MGNHDGGVTTDRDSGVAGAFLQFVARHWQQLALDLLLITAWVIVLARVIRQLGWPGWAYYVVLVGGIVVYSLFFDPWNNPDGGE